MANGFPPKFDIKRYLWTPNIVRDVREAEFRVAEKAFGWVSDAITGAETRDRIEPGQKPSEPSVDQNSDCAPVAGGLNFVGAAILHLAELQAQQTQGILTILQGMMGLLTATNENIRQVQTSLAEMVAIQHQTELKAETKVQLAERQTQTLASGFEALAKLVSQWLYVNQGIDPDALNIGTQIELTDEGLASVVVTVDESEGQEM
jgi:hypothetical protein